MRRTTLATSSLMIMIEAAGFAADPSMTVHLYDKVRLSPLELSAAKHQATVLMAAAHIRLKFVDCTANSVESGGPGVFVMVIDTTVPEHLRTVLGYAQPFSGHANRATLNYPKLLKTSPAHVESLMGTVMAHELAHLLFRSTNHGSGVMKEVFATGDIRAMHENRLRFTSAQAAELRAGLESRVTLARNLSLQ